MTERNTNRLWWGVLSGLILAILALIIGIVVVKNHNQNPDEHKNTYPATIHTAELSEINALAETLGVDEAKALYEETIASAATDLDREQARVEYGRYLLDHDLDEEGLNKLLAVDDSVLGAAYKMLLYSAFRGYFAKIGNEELSNQYNDMIGEAIKNSDYAAGG